MTTLTPRTVLVAAMVAIASVPALTACQATNSRESTAEYFDDATITTKVKAKFVEDKAVSALNIKVNTYQGTVQLSGFAKSAEEAERAAQIARSVNGVKMVKNDIRLTQ